MRMPQQQPASFRGNETEPSKQDRVQVATPKLAETSNEKRIPTVHSDGRDALMNGR